jgi:heme exporter protein D
MSNDDKFWLAAWSIIATCFITLVLSITATMWSKRQHLNDMVTKGADPIRAACALDMYDSAMMCVIHNVLQPNKE